MDTMTALALLSHGAEIEVIGCCCMEDWDDGVGCHWCRFMYGIVGCGMACLT